MSPILALMNRSRHPNQIPPRHLQSFDARVHTVEFFHPRSNTEGPPTTAATEIGAHRISRQIRPGKLPEVVFEHVSQRSTDNPD